MNETRFDTKRFLLEAGTLVAAAIVCGLISNALAARDRKLALVGRYEAARKVPERTEGAPETVSTPPAAPVAAAATPAPATPIATTVKAAPTKTGAEPATKATGPKEPTKTSTAVTAPSASAADLKTRFPAHKDTPYLELHGDDVMALHRAGALFLDARRTSVYAEGHIEKARSIPVWEADVDERVGALIAEGRDAQAPIVIYCSGGDCEDSHMLAQKLFGAGFENLYVYRDGWPDWQKRGGSSKTGDTP